jgi:hypothetical protein
MNKKMSWLADRHTSAFITKNVASLYSMASVGQNRLNKPPLGEVSPTSWHRGFGGNGVSPPPPCSEARKNPANGGASPAFALDAIVHSHCELVLKVCEASIDARFCAINAFL